MPFTVTWDEAYPTDASPANDIEVYITDDKKATRERLESLLGISDFATRFPMSADALRMGGASPKIIGGSSSLIFTASDGTTPRLTIDTTNGALKSDNINRRTVSSSGAALGFEILQPLPNVMYEVTVFGKDASGTPTNGFIDKLTVYGGVAATFTVLSSTTLVGAPGARTYSNSAGKLNLAVASGATWYIDLALTYNTA